jgi:hypothetical protein
MSMAKKLEIEVRSIGPQEAGALLGSNANPRGRHPAGRISAYGRLMTEKKWKLSIILIDEHGRLVDGFGRLTAVVNTGVAQKFVVITNWPEDCVDVIDGNKPRDPAALLRDAGVSSSRSARALVAGVVRLPHRTDIVLTNPDYVPLYELYKTGIDVVLEYSKHKGGGLPASVLVGFARAMLAGALTTEKARQGLTTLDELTFSEEDQPLRLLKKFLESTSGQAGHGPAADRYLRTVNAIHAWRSGEPMKQLKAGQDWYPVELPW